MQVTIIKLSNTSSEVSVPAGSTVADAIAKSEMSTDGYKIMRGNTELDPSSAVSDGDVITLVPRVKGGASFFVKVVKFGYASTKVEGLEDGATVADAIRRAEFSTDGYKIALNGVETTLDARLSPGNVITLNPKIKGGN